MDPTKLRTTNLYVMPSWNSYDPVYELHDVEDGWEDVARAGPRIAMTDAERHEYNEALRIFEQWQGRMAGAVKEWRERKL